MQTIDRHNDGRQKARTANIGFAIAGLKVQNWIFMLQNPTPSPKPLGGILSIFILLRSIQKREN
ncbi:hypothetical protein ACILDU_04955 [Capnocytophaga canimorsus]|uniref:hypothetical protein n=1 Tax=Capnocytophaga canimorsus TaxID=28188 RepID=UPI001BB36E00|nr:hypothetical protein [Capnocytophaga canimorsus]